MARESDEEIRETAERVMQELDLHEAEAKVRGERFQCIDEQTLLPLYWQPVPVAANSSAETPFPVAIPRDIRPGAQLGNLHLMEAGNFGNGPFYDPCRDSRQSRGAARGRRELVVVHVLAGVSHAGSVGP